MIRGAVAVLRHLMPGYQSLAKVEEEERDTGGGGARTLEGL